MRSYAGHGNVTILAVSISNSKSIMAKKKVARKKKKSTSKNGKAILTTKDKRTITQLRRLADGVVSSAKRSRDPFIDVPMRTLSNVRYSPRKRIIEMGGNTNRRQLFNL